MNIINKIIMYAVFAILMILILYFNLLIVSAGSNESPISIRNIIKVVSFFSLCFIIDIIYTRFKRKKINQNETEDNEDSGD